MVRVRSFYRGFATVIALVAFAILAVGVLFPAVRGWTPLVVLTGSMRPTIQPGDVVVMAPVDGKTVQVGDVVAYHPADSTQTLITHRVVEVRRAGVPGGEDRIVVQGDDNDVPDEPLVPGQIVGRMVYRAPGIGFFVSTVGKFLLLGVIGVLLGVDTVLERAARCRGNKKSPVDGSVALSGLTVNPPVASPAPTVDRWSTPQPAPATWSTPQPAPAGSPDSTWTSPPAPASVPAADRWTIPTAVTASAWD